MILNRKNFMNIAIIGSGISAIMTAKIFLDYNCKVYLIDSENIYDKQNTKVKKILKFNPNIRKSPKFNDQNLISSIQKFKKKYKIRTKNFFLASSLITGGLTNFWGAGLEIPDKNYFKRYSFGKSLMKEQKYLDKELKINRDRFTFFDYFFKQKIIKDMLKKGNKSIFFSKFIPAIERYDKKILTIHDYNNLDLLSGKNKYVYNSKIQLFKLLKHKNFNYIPNTFIKDVNKKKNKYKLITEDNKLLDISFKKLIISAGTIGSTILVNRIFKSSEKYRIFHTPMLKLVYFTFTLPFKISSKIRFSLPLMKLNIQTKKGKFSGSFMCLNNISNYFIGVSKLNSFFTFFKKFIYVGNIFLPPHYSNTFMKINKDKTFIYSIYKFDKNKLIKYLKNKINPFFLKYNLFEFLSQNLKFLQNGSDAHYTSTLEDKYIKGKKVLNKNCELNGFKDIHVIDGSTIKEGLHYPTYFLMLHARYISKKIIANEKKNKN